MEEGGGGVPQCVLVNQVPLNPVLPMPDRSGGGEQARVDPGRGPGACLERICETPSRREQKRCHGNAPNRLRVLAESALASHNANVPHRNWHAHAGECALCYTQRVLNAMIRNMRPGICKLGYGVYNAGYVT